MTAQQEKIRAGIRENRETLEREENKRNELIASARRAGIPWDEICEDAGLVRMTAGRYATKANGGTLPKPGDPEPRKSRRKSA